MVEDLELLLRDVSQSDDIDNGDLQAASRKIIDTCCAGLAIDRAGIWLLDDGADIIRCHQLIDTGADQNTESLLLDRQHFPHYFSALDTERAIVAHDAHTHEATAEFSEVYLKPLGICAMLDLPIRHRGKMTGIICCEHRGQPRHWSAQEQVFAAALADLYGRAVSANERAKVEAKLLDMNTNLEHIVKARTAELERALNSLTLAQERLVEQEKMAALGSLVAGIAHEVNTPLGTAITSVSHCAGELSNMEQLYADGKLNQPLFKRFITDTKEGLELAGRSLQRAAGLINDFKRTSADQVSMEIETFDLGRYIQQSMSAFIPVLKRQDIQLDLQLDEGIEMVSYPGVIAQTLTNLIANIQRHAFPKEQHFAGKNVGIRCFLHQGLAVIEVRDNGVGIPKENHKRVFEPFFTTARHAGGTGLGMSIVYNLITQKMQGQFEFDSLQNQGVTIKVTLPLRISV